MSSFELNDDDVISMEMPDFGTGFTFKFSELKQKVREFANQENKNSSYQNAKVKWFTEAGAKCEILSTQGGGWQKGRLRFRLEFIPDKPPTPKPCECSTDSSPSDFRSEVGI
ncbi:MAG: hypothetical protein KME23_17705 [Goleter apudmare HA4340-LM2]|nr:hypothetical protein [Goleter apudmare HA4340-LM2]MBW4644797.1 hypothetical protein [Goleter apudmare HA4340-LM2]